MAHTPGPWREAILQRRGGIAWTRLGWAFSMFDPRDPMKVHRASAIKARAKAEES